MLGGSGGASGGTEHGDGSTLGLGVGGTGPTGDVRENIKLARAEAGTTDGLPVLKLIRKSDGRNVMGKRCVPVDGKRNCHTAPDCALVARTHDDAAAELAVAGAFCLICGKNTRAIADSTAFQPLLDHWLLSTFHVHTVAHGGRLFSAGWYL